MTRSGTRVSRSIVQRAEALLRSLIGVSRAEVCLRETGGVDRVRLVADGGLSNGQIVQNVRSALLAGIGVALQPGQIEFVDAASWTAAVNDGTATGEPVPESASAPVALAGDRVATAESNGNGVGYARNGNSPATGQSPAPDPNGRGATNGNGQGHAPAQGNGKAAGAANGSGHGNGTSGPAMAPPVPATGYPHSHAGRAQAGGRRQSHVPAPERVLSGSVPDPGGAVAIGVRVVQLEGVETLRQAGRIRCRVILVAEGKHYSAVADCAEAPLAELQLVGRVTCDALRAGGLTETHFDGATVAHLGGSMHVLVALSGWNRGEPIKRSGSAVIGDSAEHAAALAVLHALANA